MGYQALYETAAPTALSKKLAQAYYWLEDSSEPTGEQLSAVAEAAIDIVRSENLPIEVDPADLLSLMHPVDAPTPDLVTALEAGKDGAYAAAHAEYMQAMERFSQQPKSDSPELDNEELTRFEYALAAHALNVGRQAFEPSWQALHRELLGEATADLDDADVEAYIPRMADLVHSMVEREIKHPHLATNENDAFVDATRNYLIENVYEELDAITNDPALLESLMPASVCAQLDAATPERTRSAARALKDGGAVCGCFQYLHKIYGGGQNTVDWPLLREAVEESVCDWMRYEVR